MSTLVVFSLCLFLQSLCFHIQVLSLPETPNHDGEPLGALTNKLKDLPQLPLQFCHDTDSTVHFHGFLINHGYLYSSQPVY